MNPIDRRYDEELARRAAFIRDAVARAGARGIVYGNSGGKDSALVGILCKAACADTVGVILPCASRRNYGEDDADARAVADAFGIETRLVDLTDARAAMLSAVGSACAVSDAALPNIAPRLRMTALYAIAASENRLVAGTGNRSEAYMGYFTKWGDGAHDVNPIADLTVGEVYAFLEHLGAPRAVIDKAPSAGLYDGQTDEREMGISYASIDRYLFGGDVSDAERAIIERYHAGSAHKRALPLAYPGDAAAR